MAQPVLTSKTTVTRGVMHAMEAAGMPTDDIFRSVGVDRETIENRDGRIPLAQHMALLDAMTDASNDPYFTVRVGFALGVRDLGIVGYIIQHSSTIRDGFRNLARFLRLEIEGTEVGVVDDGDTVKISYQVTGMPPEAAAKDAELSIAFGTKIMREVHTPGWCPTEVHLQHVATPDKAALEALVGAPVYLGQPASAICGPKADFDAPVRSADAELLPILTDHANQLLSAMPDQDDLIGQVRRHISDGLRHGRPNVEYVAQQMAMSPRTLQRRLSDESATFADLVDDLRRELSERYFREPRLAMTEIAFLLGYSEVSAFNRACRRWTGLSPTEVRRSLSAATA